MEVIHAADRGWTGRRLTPACQMLSAGNSGQPAPVPRGALPAGGAVGSAPVRLAASKPAIRTPAACLPRRACPPVVKGPGAGSAAVKRLILSFSALRPFGLNLR